MKLPTLPAVSHCTATGKGVFSGHLEIVFLELDSVAVEAMEYFKFMKDSSIMKHILED
jgi:hypothetical protein